MDLNILSSDLDGQELRREELSSPRFLRCDKSSDDEEIMTAVEAVSSARSLQIKIDPARWEAIFK
jgi:hypothetical protein